MSQDLPPIDMLHKLLRYEPETGNLFWRKRDAGLFSSSGYGGSSAGASRWNARFANTEAMTEVRDGYLRGKVFGKKITAHRVIWAMQKGEWPKNHIDHINGVRNDNRWVNLREATNRENSWNRRTLRTNKTGFVGVSCYGKSGKYMARVYYEVGPFDTKDEAAKAYIDAKKIICGKFEASGA